RNFGAFPAIRVGLERARGAVIAVMAADLQEPPGLALGFLEALRDGRADVAFGVRDGRQDPPVGKLLSSVFWALYRGLVMPDIPRGGVDVFAITADFRDRLLALREANTSLLAQLFWLGGRRVFLPYLRQRRRAGFGRSAWTLGKKLRYFSDSVFAFSDLPVRILFLAGAVAMGTALLGGAAVVAARVSGWVTVPGYTPTVLAILFFGALNMLGLGVVGSYAWRAFENTKARPLALVHSEATFEGGTPRASSCTASGCARASTSAPAPACGPSPTCSRARAWAATATSATASSSRAARWSATAAPSSAACSCGTACA